MSEIEDVLGMLGDLLITSTLCAERDLDTIMQAVKELDVPSVTIDLKTKKFVVVMPDKNAKKVADFLALKQEIAFAKKQVQEAEDNVEAWSKLCNGDKEAFSKLSGKLQEVVCSIAISFWKTAHLLPILPGTSDELLNALLLVRDEQAAVNWLVSVLAGKQTSYHVLGLAIQLIRSTADRHIQLIKEVLPECRKKLLSLRVELRKKAKGLTAEERAMTEPPVIRMTVDQVRELMLEATNGKTKK